MNTDWLTEWMNECRWDSRQWWRRLISRLNNNYAKGKIEVTETYDPRLPSCIKLLLFLRIPKLYNATVAIDPHLKLGSIDMTIWHANAVSMMPSNWALRTVHYGPIGARTFPPWTIFPRTLPPDNSPGQFPLSTRTILPRTAQNPTWKLHIYIHVCTHAYIYTNIIHTCIYT